MLGSAMCTVPTTPCAMAASWIARLTASARNCDIVSEPISAIPTPPVMATTVGPAPERNAPCAPALSAACTIGSQYGKSWERYCWCSLSAIAKRIGENCAVAKQFVSWRSGQC